MSDIAEGSEEAVRPRYPVICLVCGHQFYASKSLMMTCFGINRGGASCPKCNTYLTLRMHPDLNGISMTSARHKDSYEDTAAEFKKAHELV